MREEGAWTHENVESSELVESHELVKSSESVDSSVRLQKTEAQLNSCKDPPDFVESVG